MRKYKVSYTYKVLAIIIIIKIDNMTKTMFDKGPVRDAYNRDYQSSKKRLCLKFQEIKWCLSLEV